MEGPILPEGSGGEEPPEWTAEADLSLEERALQQYEARMRSFADGLFYLGPKRKRRRTISGYRAKNCEETWGNRFSEGR